jgi:hypothetical protein
VESQKKGVEAENAQECHFKYHQEKDTPTIKTIADIDSMATCRSAPRGDGMKSLEEAFVKTTRDVRQQWQNNPTLFAVTWLLQRQERECQELATRTTIGYDLYEAQDTATVSWRQLCGVDLVSNFSLLMMRLFRNSPHIMTGMVTLMVK